ncbi:MAG: hypothetical protein H6718_34615 [Polyangiaceae bacterium]|nr:hypothetical protein [Myxococcales bacterium]MCB9590594.1 hypothetical protein [Polyangiaceae bacterium]MCB9608140.1 hypothetical protein [Polyangiaceae bacterium]
MEELRSSSEPQSVLRRGTQRGYADLRPGVLVRTLARWLSAVGLAGSALLSASTASADPSDLPPETGFDYGDVETPRTAAMGGALRAFSSSTESIYINPGNMAASRVYHIGALAALWPEASRQTYGAAAVDSVGSRTQLAGGLAFAFNRQDPDGVDRQWNDLRFALAFPFSQQFQLGMAGRVMWMKENGDGPLGNDAVAAGLPDENIVRDFTFDAGMSFRPTPEFAVSLVGNSLTNPDHGYLPSRLGGGIGYGTPDFTLEGDLVADFTTWQRTTVLAMGGFEYLAGNVVPLRVGYRYDEGPATHWISAGLGYVDQQVSAEISARRSVAGEKATAVIIGFKYHLESAGAGISGGFD